MAVQYVVYCEGQFVMDFDSKAEALHCRAEYLWDLTENYAYSKPDALKEVKIYRLVEVK